MTSAYGSAGDVERGGPPAYVDTPPTYDEVTDPNAPPPSYDALYGEFKQIDSPKGFAFFIRKSVGFIIGTVMMAVCLAIMQIFPICMVVIGSMNLKNCPIDRYIPIYLVVAGSVALFKALTNFYYRVKARENDENIPENNVTPNPFDGVINCFLIVWFITGSVWVYRVNDSVQYNNMSSDYYCDHVTYQFAWWSLTLTYIFLLLSCFFMCCCGCFAFCCRPTTRTESQTN